jgi:hypothetical protein
MRIDLCRYPDISKRSQVKIWIEDILYCRPDLEHRHYALARWQRQYSPDRPIVLLLPPQAGHLTCHDRANYRLTRATPTP